MRIPLDWSCPIDQICAFNVPVSLDTTKLQDGWREIRLRAETETPDDKRFLSSSAIPLLVNNGGSRDDYNRGTNQGLIGMSWYEEFGYSLAKFYQTLPSYEHKPYWADCTALYPVRQRFRDYFRAQVYG